MLVFRELHLRPSSRSRSAATSARSTARTATTRSKASTASRSTRRRIASASYLRGTFAWHVDGCTPDGDECPQMATVLIGEGGLRAGRRDRVREQLRRVRRPRRRRARRAVRTLRVVHSLEASQRRVRSDPTPKQLAAWRSRPSHEHPLVWTHRNGRRSLLLGASADHVVGMDLDEGRALLDELLARATTPGAGVPARVVGRRHRDLGQPRRVAPRRAVRPDSGREMLRTTILGDEPIQ